MLAKKMMFLLASVLRGIRGWADRCASVSLLEITLAGDPIPKGRPRTARGVTYTPPRTRAAEKAVAALVRQKLGPVEPFAGAVGLAVEFFCATRRHTDGDNLVKLVTDACNGLVYADDFQIEECYYRVHRGVGAQAARTELFMYPLEEATG
jgi:crossover junction endodeoxyribonuclease RusA